MEIKEKVFEFDPKIKTSKRSLRNTRTENTNPMEIRNALNHFAVAHKKYRERVKIWGMTK